MTAASNVEQLIKTHAEKISSDLPQLLNESVSEEDIRHRLNSLLDQFLQDANLSISGRHEYGLAGGYIDSRYAGVILEYKTPTGADALTASKESASNRKALKQLQGRFADFRDHENTDPSRLFGMVTNGHLNFIVRYRDDEFVVDGPHPLTSSIVERLLRALVSLAAHGKSYIPETLASDFAGDSPIAKAGIRSLYQTLRSTRNPKVKTLFEQWRLLFGEVCGYKVDEKNDRISQLAQFYGLQKNAVPSALLFSIHSYYAIVTKLLAAEMASSLSPIGVTPIRKAVGAPTNEKLRAVFANLESGSVWSLQGIGNFLEGDLFSWYLSAWDEDVAQVVREVVEVFDQYDPSTLSVEPEDSRDLLKNLYQELFPKAVRKSLGEYYTPDWLAGYVFDESHYQGDDETRVLDPACGSGTFLVEAINRIRRWYSAYRDQAGISEGELLEHILRNVVGFDLNPLAVMAARTNYLLAIRDLLPYAHGRVEIPVYLCDSVATPSEYTGLLAGAVGLGAARELPTAVQTFIVPSEVAQSHHELNTYAGILEQAVKDDYGSSDFVEACRAEGLRVDTLQLHEDLYGILAQLQRDNRNGIWARIIKNAFAPVFVGEFDLVVGNPPWINWENLPGGYRQETSPIWDRYGLRTDPDPEGRNSIGRWKSEVAALFVYACADQYLKPSGRLGFVVTQSLFKNAGGAGFRTWKISDQKWFADIRVADLVGIPVFGGAVNRTAVFCAHVATDDSRSEIASWEQWKRKAGSRIHDEDPLVKVRRQSEVTRFAAVPSEPNRWGSPLLTCPEPLLQPIQSALGDAYFDAHEGINPGGLTRCFRINVLEMYSDAAMVKSEDDEISGRVELDSIYPLVRGVNVSRWQVSGMGYFLLTHSLDDRKAISPTVMKSQYRGTYAYLKQFEGELVARKSAPVRSLMDHQAFYAVLGVGRHLSKPWKVVYKDLTNFFQAAVVGTSAIGDDQKPVLPDYTLRVIGFDSREEALYVCGVLNSSISLLSLYYSSTGVQTQRYSATDAERVAIKPFVGADWQLAVVEAAELAHDAVEESAVDSAERDLDQAVAAGLGLSLADLSNVRAHRTQLESAR